MAANSSVYFLRFPFADESEILPGFSFMNESKKKYVIILIILDKLRFIIEKSYKNMTMHTFIAFPLFFPYVPDITIIILNSFRNIVQQSFGIFPSEARVCN